uniref:Odorant receptor n=1 Tax=Pyrrhalta maculicollis TaxID=226885 RepID=A0A1J0KKI4_9CUCU|nr:odorant receptor 2 [Pyrrhalta maculicollis]
MILRFSIFDYFRPNSHTTDYGKSMLWFVKFLLEAIFIWPDTERPELLIISCIIIWLAGIFSWWCVFSYIIVNIEDFNKAVYGMCLLSIPTMIVMKMPFVLFKFKALKNLLKQIETEFWPYDVVDSETKKELKEVYSISIGFMFFCFFIVQIYHGATLVIPVFLEERVLPLPCSLPFEWTDGIPYALIYIVHFICLELGITFGVLGLDILILCLCICTSNQYRILRKCFLIYNTVDMRETNDLLRTITKRSMDNYSLEKEYLVRLIDHHNLLLRFTTNLNEVLSPLELGQLVISIMALCLGTYVLSMEELSTFHRTFAFIYLIGFNLQLVIDCTVGAEIYHQATFLPHCVFHSNWMSLEDTNLKKDILFVLQSSQRFPQLMAYNLYSMDMVTFLKIQKFTLSVYTLLSNMSAIKQNVT